jgi:hypothetical protein
VFPLLPNQDSTSIVELIMSRTVQDIKEDKIKWFCLRTGASSESAKMWLQGAQWKIDNAIDDRKAFLKQEQIFRQTQLATLNPNFKFGSTHE